LVEVADEHDLVLIARDINQLVDVHSVSNTHCDQLGIVRRSEGNGLGDRVGLAHVGDTVTPEYYQIGHVGAVAACAREQLLAGDLEGVGHVGSGTHVRDGINGTEKLCLAVVGVQGPEEDSAVAELDRPHVDIVSVHVKLLDQLLDAFQQHGPVVRHLSDTSRRVNQHGYVERIDCTSRWCDRGGGGGIA